MRKARPLGVGLLRWGEHGGGSTPLVLERWNVAFHRSRTLIGFGARPSTGMGKATSIPEHGGLVMNPEVGSLWERKRDKRLVKVDHVKKGVVTYTCVYELILWDTPLTTWAAKFRAHTPTEYEAAVAARCPISRE